MQEDGYITAKQHTDAKFPQTAAVAQQNEYKRKPQSVSLQLPDGKEHIIDSGLRAGEVLDSARQRQIVFV